MKSRRIQIRGAQVLLSEPEFKLERTDIFIEDGKITALGCCDNLAADTVIEAGGKLVMPGLINCHTHAYMSVFRNYADDLSFEDWLFGKIMPVEEQLTSADAYWCSLLSCMEMIKTGTTCFLDMHMFPGQSVRAAAESGMRAVISRGLVSDAAEPPEKNRRLTQALQEMRQAEGNARISFMLAPHAIYTCDAALLRHVSGLAAERGLGLHIHLAESRAEAQNCIKEHGLTPTAYLDSLGFFGAPTVAAHCVQLTAADIEILRARGVSVATNPISNMKLGNGFAPVCGLLDVGVNVCVGTDGAASNNSLNMFGELATLSYIHKGISENAQALPATQALACGTLNGAQALGLKEQTGSIAVGKRADLLVLDLHKPHLQPLNNPLAGLIYSATGTEVETVLIDGEIVMEKGELKTIDEQRVYAEMERIRCRLSRL